MSTYNSRIFRETAPGTNSAGGAGNYETMAGIDAQQAAITKILQSTIPRQYGSGGGNNGGSSDNMLLIALDPNRKSNPPLTISPNTSTTSSAQPKSSQIPAVQVSSNYYTLGNSYGNTSW